MLSPSKLPQSVEPGITVLQIMHFDQVPGEDSSHTAMYDPKTLIGNTDS